MLDILKNLPERTKKPRFTGITMMMDKGLSINQAKEFISVNSKYTDIIKLEKAPKVAVYSPEGNLPWDDAVTMVLTYSEIPYDIIYDEEILSDLLPMYD